MSDQEEMEMFLGYMDVPEVITPEMREVSGQTVVMTSVFPRRPETDQKRFVAVSNDQLFIIVQGQIRYKDIFSDMWLYTFRRRWENGIVSKGEQVTLGRWEETSEEENNETACSR